MKKYVIPTVEEIQLYSELDTMGVVTGSVPEGPGFYPGGLDTPGSGEVG